MSTSVPFDLAAEAQESLSAFDEWLKTPEGQETLEAAVSALQAWEQLTPEERARRRQQHWEEWLKWESTVDDMGRPYER